MQEESVLVFFQALGFEEIEIEDSLTALSVEYSSDGSYALLTDDEGNKPETLKQSLIFAFYSPEGAYQWSTSFKNAYTFKDTWLQGETIMDKCQAVRQLGEEKGGELD